MSRSKPPTSIKVGGKPYYSTHGTHGWIQQKSTAESHVRRLRKDGYNARIKKYEKGYVVFGRQR